MNPVLFIAEAGVNHNGELALALRLCDVAKAAGAQIVKFQTFRAEDLVSPTAPTAAYQERETGESSQFAMLKKLELSEADHHALFRHCESIGIEFCSTPFSEDAVVMLMRLGLKRLKLPSGELTHRALLEAAADTGLPLIVSTGMATVAEVADALDWIRSRPNASADLTLLHCTSAYPAADEDLNLLAMHHLAREFGVPVGYSDHSLGLEGSLAAAALGARVIEKHFTLDRSLPGPDHAASLLPDELTRLVAGVRRVERMRGDGVKQPTAEEREVAQVARRSVTALADLSAGQMLSLKILGCRRPAGGIAPADMTGLVGRRLAKPVVAGQALRWTDLEADETGHEGGGAGA